MLYIMRHGKTEWNELHKLQGQTDIPLNENGRKMAREAGNGIGRFILTSATVHR